MKYLVTILVKKSLEMDAAQITRQILIESESLSEVTFPIVENQWKSSLNERRSAEEYPIVSSIVRIEDLEEVNTKRVGKGEIVLLVDNTNEVPLYWGAGYEWTMNINKAKTYPDEKSVFGDRKNQERVLGYSLLVLPCKMELRTNQVKATLSNAQKSFNEYYLDLIRFKDLTKQYTMEDFENLDEEKIDQVKKYWWEASEHIRKHCVKLNSYLGESYNGHETHGTKSRFKYGEKEIRMDSNSWPYTPFRVWIGDPADKFLNAGKEVVGGGKFIPGPWVKFVVMELKDDLNKAIEKDKTKQRASASRKRLDMIKKMI